MHLGGKEEITSHYWQLRDKINSNISTFVSPSCQKINENYPLHWNHLVGISITDMLLIKLTLRTTEIKYYQLKNCNEI